MTRLAVNKTYKLFIGGAFPRSESGRTFPVRGPDHELIAHACLASRKDTRIAVVAARKAQPAWAARTAYNRAQILYRIAEVMEARQAEFVVELEAAGIADADLQVAAAIDRWVWYAGWADKYSQVLGGVNPVAGPYFNFNTLEPMGVIGVVADDDQPLVACVSRLAPGIVSGNTAVVLAPQIAPLVTIALAETLATSDVPGGVVNILTGSRTELVPWLADHADVDAVDVSGCNDELATIARQRGSATVTRFVTASTSERDWCSAAAESPYLIEAFCETKAVWHPIGK